MYNNDNEAPKCVSVFGKMHGGKTTFLENLMAARPSVLVYNAGKPTDWKDYLLIDLEVEGETLYFWYRDQRHPFKDYMRHLRGKHVKCFSDDDVEKYLFIELSSIKGRHYAGLVLVFDDTSGRMKDGKLVGKQLDLFSRAKHAGVEVYIIFHGWGMMPPVIWNLLTHAICFAVKTAPPDKVKRKLKDSSNLQVIQTVHNILSKKAPPYSYARIDLDSSRWELFGPGGTKFQLKNMEENALLEKVTPMLPVMEMAIDFYIKKFFKELLEKHEAKSDKVWARVSFGQQLKVLAKEGKKTLYEKTHEVEELAETIVNTSQDPEAAQEIPTVVTTMLPMLGVNLSDIMNIETVSFFLKGSLFKHKTIYSGLIKGKQTYSIKQKGKLTNIQFKEVWKV